METPHPTLETEPTIDVEPAPIQHTEQRRLRIPRWAAIGGSALVMTGIGMVVTSSDRMPVGTETAAAATFELNAKKKPPICKKPNRKLTKKQRKLKARLCAPPPRKHRPQLPPPPSPELPVMVPPTTPGTPAIPPIEGPTTPPEILPPTELLTNPEHVRALQDASIKLVSRPKGSNSNWAEWCSGVLVNFNGVNYILSASHCFAEETGDATGVVDIPQAQNYIAQSEQEYAVVNPSDDIFSREDPNGPLAKVTGISVAPKADSALLSFTVTKPTAFAAFKPISIDAARIGDNPESGAPVVIHGSPQANGHKPVTTPAKYLGSFELITYTNLIPRKMHWIGYTLDSPEQDACNFAGSGEYATVAWRDGKMSLLGPASVRGAKAYLNGVLQPEDSPQFLQEIKDRFATEGKDVSEYNIICGMSDTNNDSIPQLVGGLTRIA